jgi:hypothetical protein
MNIINVMKMNPSSSIYMIGLGSKNLSVRSKSVDYVIGFKNVMLARAIHYSLPPYPQLSIVRGDEVDLTNRLVDIGIGHKNTKLIIDPSATIFIPKTKGTIWHPNNDIGFFLDVKRESEFMTYPMTKGLGIIIPQDITMETDDEFVLKSFLIEPIKAF